MEVIKNFFCDIKQPQTQSLLVYGLILGMMLCTFAVQKFSPDTVDVKFYWLICTAFMVVYSVFNSLACLMADKVGIYFRNSVYCFAALGFIGGYTAYLFSGLNIFEAGTYSWLFKVVFVVYLTFMSLVFIMKFVVEFAQKEEWNSPKLRKK